jgi:hypothetical protein
LVRQVEDLSLRRREEGKGEVGEKVEKGWRVREAGLILGGGVIRQPSYREVVLRMLSEQGVTFGTVVTVEDVAEEGARGLVERARGRRAGRGGRECDVSGGRC